MAKAAQTVVGTVKAVSQYGVKIEGHEDWYNYSKPEYRMTPFEMDSMEKGARVELVVDGKYIQACKVVEAPEFDDFEPDPTPPPEALSGTRNVGYDRETGIIRQTCMKAAVEVVARHPAFRELSQSDAAAAVVWLANQLEDNVTR